MNTRLHRIASCMMRLVKPLLASDLDFESFMQPGTGEDIDLAAPDFVLLPVTRFSTEDEAGDIWEKVAQSLTAHSIGPSNVWPDVDGIFAELALNAAQHSLSPLGCYATLECFTSGKEIVYVVGLADFGIGIPSSLRKNPEHIHIANDNDAILRATEMGVTGTLEPRGVGLHHVTERVRAYLGELAIISGAGFLAVTRGQEPVRGNFSELNLPSQHSQFNGTISLVSLPIPLLR